MQWPIRDVKNALKKGCKEFGETSDYLGAAMNSQSDEAPTGEILIHESGNGDKWYLGEHPATGLRAVRHVANSQSGGHVSHLGIESFLLGSGPEHQALRHLIETKREATILIAYDIHPPWGTAYDQLVEAIQSLGAWWHHLETVWIIRTNKAPAAIRDRLKGHLGADDQLLVLDISGDRAEWVGVNDTGSKWLVENVQANV
jgi:sugar/nucleoside kinase (ribokinase family)